MDVVTLSAAIAQNKNFLQGTKLALAAAIIFIGCFSVMNLLNSILTGIITRCKEFALMRSVGMSKKQLSSMIHYESLIVVSIGLFLSLAIGGGIGYVICIFLKSSLMGYLNYLGYAMRRLSVFPNLRWSLANEYDIIKYRKEDCEYFEVYLHRQDAFGHLLSNHNMIKQWDFANRDTTHICLQIKNVDEISRKIAEFQNRL